MAHDDTADLLDFTMDPASFDRPAPVAILLGRAIVALQAAGIEVSNRWGRAPLYIEQGRNKPARIVRTPGTSGHLAAALTALRDAGFTATLRDQRISITAA